MGYKVKNSDIIEFCNNYKGELFHSAFMDSPYHLQSIVDRFGKESSAPAKFGNDGAFQRASKGFAGKVWDGGDIAFDPETWKAIKNLLYPGAFSMSFGSSRGWHRMACSIEDAGFIIHPTIFLWIRASSFPKATRVKDNGEDVPGFEGYRYGGQALRPAVEPVIVFQKPYEGRPVDCIKETGAGVLDIDNSRISINPDVDDKRLGGRGSWKTDKAGKDVYDGGWSDSGIDIKSNSMGRWPSNFIPVHDPLCNIIGRKPVEGYSINRWKDNAHPFGNGAGNKYETQDVEGGYEDVYSCVDGCAVKALNEQSGILKSGEPGIIRKGHNDGPVYHEESRKPGTLMTGFGDEGGASRFFFNSDYALERLENEDPFFYCAKVNKEERDAGCDELEEQERHTMGNGLTGISGDRTGNGKKKEIQMGIAKVHNNHPSLKPIKLNKHLANLLLPPDMYAPRRILVPFSGSGSEMIGALLTGWEEIVGVELEKEYCEIAQNRLKFWSKYKEAGITDPKIILQENKKNPIHPEQQSLF